MTRRTFFAAWLAACIRFKRRTLGYGYLDVERHVALRQRGIYLRVLLDGQDVSRHCFEADDQLGFVGLYKQNKNGQHFIDSWNREIAREFRHGRVQFVEVTQAEWNQLSVFKGEGG